MDWAAAHASSALLQILVEDFGFSLAVTLWSPRGALWRIDFKELIFLRFLGHVEMTL